MQISQYTQPEESMYVAIRNLPICVTGNASLQHGERRRAAIITIAIIHQVNNQRRTHFRVVINGILCFNSSSSRCLYRCICVCACVCVRVCCCCSCCACCHCTNCNDDEHAADDPSAIYNHQCLIFHLPSTHPHCPLTLTIVL